MAPFLMYLLKANLVISIFFLAYYYLLRKEKFFRLNRIVLLSAIGLAFLLPLLPAIESATETPLERGMSDISPFTHWGDLPNAPSVNTHVQSPVVTPKAKQNTISVFTVANILNWLYLLVTVVMLLRLLFQIQQVGRSFPPVRI